MKSTSKLTALLTLTTLSLAACAAEPELEAADAPEVEEIDPEALQQVENNGWTMNASVGGGYAYANAAVTLTGPAGTTSKSGVCLTNVYQLSYMSYKACSSVTDCAGYPATLPTGGFRYCEAINGSGQKYCMNRLGPQSTHCEGYTPPGSYVELGPGTHGTGNINISASTASWAYQGPNKLTVWTGIGCLNGPCGASNPYSVSNLTVLTVP